MPAPGTSTMRGLAEDCYNSHREEGWWPPVVTSTIRGLQYFAMKKMAVALLWLPPQRVICLMLAVTINIDRWIFGWLCGCLYNERSAIGYFTAMQWLPP